MASRRQDEEARFPKGVTIIRRRNKDGSSKLYYYWQRGRGTDRAEARKRLPDDPHSPEFWIAVRECVGEAEGPSKITFGAILDEYLVSAKFRALSKGTQDQYKIQIRTARAAFGHRAPEAIRPALVRAMMEGMADRPGTANSFLGVMRALSTWGIARDYFRSSLTEGVAPYEKTGGHKPWTDAQIAAVSKLTGEVRRGIMLGLYTGQRGSDLVRLGWTDIEEGGFRLRQQKTKREIWCPILPELEAEMATWEKRPGPFLRQSDGRPYTRKRLSIHYDKQRSEIPELAGASIHGLRATAVVRLRRAGLATAQIQDIIGMSMAMIERYSRFADKKISGKAAVVTLRAAQNKNGTRGRL